jgi:hypothetical protein
MRRQIGTTVAAALALWAVALVPDLADATVSGTPAATPQLAESGTDGSVEVVRQITQCGATMYAVGTFGAVQNAGSDTAIPRRNAFAFSATAPYQVTGWNPAVDGTVDTVACAPDGSILLGGSFSTAGGAANRNAARVDAAGGAALGFGFHPGGTVWHMEVVQGHLIAGGSFPGFLTSVSPTSGSPDGYATPQIAGSYSYPGVSATSTRVHNMAPSPDGTALVISGDFTSVGGQHHEQLARLNLTPAGAAVSAWEPTELETHCDASEPFYARDAAWSPDGSQIYTATTGYKPDGSSAAGQRTGPCDALIAYPATETRFDGHTWINYTGCDSYYSVAADGSTVFAAGHQRWVDNTYGCDAAGPGAIEQQGLAEFNPADGSHQPGPDRGRGQGADDMLRTSAGLWIASDNLGNTGTCAGEGGHMGICFLPG